MTSTTPLSDADAALLAIQQLTWQVRAHVKHAERPAGMLRYYLDQLRNSLQTLEACAAELEGPKPMARWVIGEPLRADREVCAPDHEATYRRLP